MASNNGGPAFPQPETVNGNTVHDEHGQGGMSLRDWFAGQALAGLISHQGLTSHVPGHAMTPIQESIYQVADGHPLDQEYGNLSEAIVAYEVADAMLAARAARAEAPR